MSGPHTYTAGDVLTAADCNTFLQGWWGSYSGTTDASGILTVTHGAPFTPSVVFVQTRTPSSGSNIADMANVTSVGATTFVVRSYSSNGSTATLAVTGYYWCLP